MRGIVSYGAYVPYWRLQRSAITSTLGSGGGKGTRSVASYDEDTTSMGVEAARIALRAAPEGTHDPTVWFATTEPAYLDKTNATAIHAALGLASSVGAYDVNGAVRSNVAACIAADATDGLAILSDIRTGLPGGADEANGGDAAVAFLFGEGEVIAETIGGAGATGEFLDRWRAPGGVGLAHVGGALRRARLRAAGRAGRHRRAQVGRADGGRPRPRHRGRPARPRGAGRGQGHRRPTRGLRRRPHLGRRQPRSRPGRPPAGRRPRPGRARPDDRAGAAGRRRRRRGSCAPPTPSSLADPRRPCASRSRPPATT